MIKVLGALCLGIGVLLIPAVSYSENKGMSQRTTAGRSSEAPGTRDESGQQLSTNPTKARKYILERIGNDWHRAETVSPETADQVEQALKAKQDGDNNGE